MARKKKISLLMKLIDSIQKKWEEASIRDLVYIVSYVAAVAGSYKVLMASQAFIVTYNPVRWLFPGDMPTKEELKKIDVDTLLTAFVVGYIVLKIDADDITSGIAKVTAALAKSPL